MNGPPLSPEQAAIVNFMGQIYGQLKQIDNNMVEASSTLRPTSQTVEKVLRDQLQRRAVPIIPPTPDEIRASGVVPPKPPENENVTTPTDTGQPPQVPDTYIGDPLPETHPDVVTPIPTGPITSPPLPAAPSVKPQPEQRMFVPEVVLDVVEITKRLDIIIEEFRKLNNMLGHEIADNEG